MIHPTAIIDRKAEVDPSAEIGAYAVVGPGVVLGPGCVLRPHAHVTGHTEIGPECQIYSFASIGEEPQDKKYRGEHTRLVIGARNTMREYVTIHPGTAGGTRLTLIGDDNLFMIGAHIAHDCQIGSDVVMANGTTLAGHVLVEDHAYFGGNAAVIQFARIGESAALSGLSGVIQDVAPFTLAVGAPARVMRVNTINLERRGFSPERIHEVERAFRLIFRSGLRPREAFARVREELPGSREAEHMVAFLEKSERGFTRMR